MSQIVQKVHMLIVMQPDIAKAIAFYQTLGLKLIFHIKDKWAEMQLGDIKLGLCPTSVSSEGTRTGIVLQVADVKKAYNELKDSVEFMSEPKEAVHGIMVSFKDAGGNLLDLYQPTPEKITELVKKTAEQDLDNNDNDVSGCVKKGAQCCKKKINEVALG